MGPRLSAAPATLRVLADAGASYTVQMSTEDWAALPDHPRQRDTIRQARKGHWELARAARGPALEALRWVTAAEFEGRLYKVDGHARALLWTSGGLPNPGTVLATVHRCRDRTELNELYGTFDTASAAETIFDKVTGAFREQGLALKSKRLRSGTIADALSIAMRGFARGEAPEDSSQAELDVYEAVRTFAPELKLLDSVNPQNEIFYTGVLAAALLSLALDPSTLEFFRRISLGQGSKKEGLLDPIEGMLWIIGKLKNKSARFRREQERLAATTLGAVDVWQHGESAPGYWSTGKYEPVDLSKAVQRARELKGASGHRS